MLQNVAFLSILNHCFVYKWDLKSKFSVLCNTKCYKNPLKVVGYKQMYFAKELQFETCSIWFSMCSRLSVKRKRPVFWSSCSVRERKSEIVRERERGSEIVRERVCVCVCVWQRVGACVSVVRLCSVSVWGWHCQLLVVGSNPLKLSRKKENCCLFDQKIQKYLPIYFTFSAQNQTLWILKQSAFLYELENK